MVKGSTTMLVMYVCGQEWLSIMKRAGLATLAETTRYHTTKSYMAKLGK